MEFRHLKVIKVKEVTSEHNCLMTREKKGKRYNEVEPVK